MNNLNNSIFINLLCAIFLAILSISSHAELIDRGDGLIYDSVQDLTWTQDAGMSNGVKWDEAMSWAESLVYKNFDDWRLPTTSQFPKYPDSAIDPDCSGDVRGDFFFESRLGCLEGEMERLAATCNPWTCTDPVFENVNRTRYWTSTPYRDGIDPCIYFDTGGYEIDCTLENDDGIRDGFYWQWGFTGWGGFGGDAYKTTLGGGNDRSAWAVRDGDVCGSYSLPVNTWTMLGLLCTPVAPATVSSVFGDDLDVSQYGVRWAMYEWDAATDSYSRLSLFDELSQNKGYWILSLDAASLDVDGVVTQAIDSTECPVQQGCYEIPLTPPANGETEQYNLVGHTFPGTVTIPWKDVRIKAGGIAYTPSEAALPINNIMDETIWLYNGNVYNPYNEDTPGMVGQLTAFDGFWVRVLSGAPADITLLLPKVPVP